MIPALNFSQYRRTDLIWLALFTFVLLALGIGFRAPWPADEPRFALIAKDMVETGQWLFPLRGNELYPDKPPLFMWSIALVYALTHSLYIAFLLPSALAGTVTVLAIFDICRRLWSSREAWWAAGLLLASIQFVVQAKSAQIDASVCMWITLGCYGLLRATLVQNAGIGWWLAGCIAMGLGIMTKGVGFLPLLMLLPYLLCACRNSALPATRSQVPILARYHWLWWVAGVGIMIVTLLLWFAPMWLSVESLGNSAYAVYRDNIMMKQTVTRYANSWHHIKPFWYFFVSVIPWAWLPLVVLLPWQWRHWRYAWNHNDARILMPLGFVLLMLLFFSLSPGKRGVYILPALPMLVLSMAPAMPAIARSKGLSRVLWGLTLLLASALLLVGLLGAIDIGPLTRLKGRYHVDGSGLLTSTGLTMLLALLFMKGRPGWQAWGGAMLLFWCFYSVGVAWLLNPIRTPASIWQTIDRVVPEHSEIALVDTGEQFMLFARRRIVHFGYHTSPKLELYAAWKWLKAHEGGYVLLPADTESSCFELGAGRSVGYAHRKDWLLVGSDSLSADCVGQAGLLAPTVTAPIFHYEPQNPLIR